MKRFALIFLILVSCNSEKNSRNVDPDLTTVFEMSNGTETATYEETIQYYTKLANTYSQINLQSIGETDSGKPLHLVTLNAGENFDFNTIRKNKTIVLINNGIHPGESDGIDATMLLFRDLVQGKIYMPENVVLATIPIYNVGGSLNRNSTTRTNQNGPESYGFRGNSRNYDLNRDFIKSDTKNARTFAEIFHLVRPDVFIDNHVSNGADYQYVLTHLFTQHNKLGDKLGHYLRTNLQPKLEQNLKDKKWDITPYVNVFNRTPEQGFSQFLDYPRYSTGYTSLFNTLGMMVETHMLKPYKDRVEGTLELMKSMVEIVNTESETIKSIRSEMPFLMHKRKNYVLDWKIDTIQSTTLNFKGYEGEITSSEITGADRLKYNKSKPFNKAIDYQNHFVPSIEVSIPKAYIIPQSWHKVIDLLKLNKVEFKALAKDSVLTVEAYTIKDYQTRNSAYEGHYPHYNTNVNSQDRTIQFRKGDFIVPTNQYAFRYLMETLEPQAPDSFFNWNFFDSILQQKEHFSPYVWEDKALELLSNNEELKTEFEDKKKNDKDFAQNWYAQLDWLHKQSEHYERAHMQYPIYRLN